MLIYLIAIRFFFVRSVLSANFSHNFGSSLHDELSVFRQQFTQSTLNNVLMWNESKIL